MTTENIFNLNRDNLDKEWLRQPNLMYEYCMKLADAKAVFDRAKSKKEVQLAELNMEARNQPERFGIVKVTEAAIESVVSAHQQTVDANEAVIAAKHEVDVLQATVDALHDRRKALENLVQLHGMAYFAEPSTPRHIPDVKADMAFGKSKRRIDKGEDD